MEEHRRRITDVEHPGAIIDLAAAAAEQALNTRLHATLRAAFIAGLIAALLVCLPITIIGGARVSDSARANAEYNCGVLTVIADVMGSGDPSDPQLKGGGFVSTDAFLREQQAFNSKQIMALRPGALKALLNDPETLRLAKKSQGLDKATTGYWRTVLIPRLQQIARINCSRLPGA